MPFAVSSDPAHAHLGPTSGDDLAPVFRIEVNDIPILKGDINQFVTQVEFESAIDMADLFKVVLDNPGLVDDFFPNWADYKAFQAGNEVSLFVGYGGADRPENFVGRAEWAKTIPIFPREGMPQLELKAYSLMHRMMNGTGTVFNAAKIAKPSTTRPVDGADDQGQVFANIRHSEVVAFLADMYGFEKDIDHTTRQDSVVLKKGMKHYDVIKALANLNNRDFWVDYDNSRRKWVLHWRNINREQQAEFIFRYNAGDGSTILEAEPEFGIRDTINEAVILIFDAERERWVSAIEISEFAGEDPRFTEGGGLQARSTAQGSGKTRRKKKRPAREARSTPFKDKEIVKEALENPGAFRIATAGFSIDVLPPPGPRFKTAADAATWLRRWFIDKQNNFITVNGVVIGVETLRARQVHRLEGLGPRLNGDYYFTKVRHLVAAGGYTCEFTANRVIKE